MSQHFAPPGHALVAVRRRGIDRELARDRRWRERAAFRRREAVIPNSTAAETRHTSGSGAAQGGELGVPERVHEG
jgi:hypothetical protein